MDDLTPAALKSGLDYMGLSAVWFANRCEVTKRTVFRWFDGVSPIPQAAAEEFDGVWQQTTKAVEGALARGGYGKLLTYRTDRELWAAIESEEFPASWHRAVTVRAAERLIERYSMPVQIEYAE